MKKSYYSWMMFLRNALMAINTFVVMYYVSIQMLAVKLIIDTQKTTSFVVQLTHIPKNPRIVFIGCILCLLVLGATLMRRRISYIENIQENIAGAAIETVMAVVISLLLNFSCSGIFLLVFCDCIFHFRRSKKGREIIFLNVLLYFFCNYKLINLVYPLMDTRLFFSVFSNETLLILINSVAEALIIIMTVAYIGLFLTWQIQENEDISQELSMVSQVNQELRNYASITEKIGEDKERKRLAREIHDTLGHALVGIASGVDACIAIIDKNPDAAKNQLQLVSKVVRQGITDVRNSLKKLRPGALEEQGLKGALIKMIQEFQGVSDVKINFVFEADQADFDVAKENVLFRLIQESMTNAIRHGKANEIDIHIFVEENDLIVDIQDNGQGCEKIVYGYGLRQMEERILTVHGHIEYDGTNGFKTHAIIPLQKGEKS